MYKNGFLAFIYWDGWAKLLLHRLIKDLRLGLELMPNVWVPLCQIMTPSCITNLQGGEVHGWGPHSCNPTITFSINFFILTKNCYPPCPTSTKMPSHSWRPFVHGSHMQCTLLQGPKFNLNVHFPLVNKQLTKISFPKWNRRYNM